MSQKNDKKIRYVSIDPSAILLDPQFISLSLHQRGLYLSILLYLFVNNGTLISKHDCLSRILGLRVRDFDKSFSSISHLFTNRRGKISSPFVLNALRRAADVAKMQSDKGVSSAKARGYKSDEKNPVEPSEAKRTEEKISEVKKSEEKINEEKASAQLGDVSRNFYNTEKSKVRGVSTIGSVLANSSSLMPRSASPSTVDVTMMQIKFYDQLCRIFSKRTPADTSSLHNLTSWVRQQVSQGRWTAEIFERILDIARQSVQGKPRKPLAVFYSQLKSELGYRCIESAAS